FLVRGKAAFSLPGKLKLACAAALFAIIIWGSFYFLRARNSVVNTPEIAGRETITPAPTITATPHASQSENSTAVLALNDGGKQITLDATGNVTGINFISSADEKLAANALRVGQVETPAELKQLSSPGSGLMGTSRDETFRLISPTGKIVASNRPTLQWQALSGASSYVVTIANPQTNFVLSSETITTTQWKPTEPLPRGQTYTWQVTAIKDGKETKSPLPDAPDAQFRILSQREFDEIAQAEKAYVGNHLMLGLVYARKGLLSESEIHFNALLAANPQSQVAKRLLQDIRINSRR
ncbi:MAG TPA: hypothetical protein VEF04_15820, partial [Blastocatellia bacterium]|nr:hypothetical protein [Blastocatellia bacterium]